MTTERRPPPPTPLPAAPANGLRRIPLPPLPHFRGPGSVPQATPAEKPAPAAGAGAAPAQVVESVPGAAFEAPRKTGPVSPLEMSELLGPEHEGGIAPAIDPITPQRTGATGARILNDLVDEIEKGLEKELARTPMELMPQGYRRVVACASGPAASRVIGPGPDRPAPKPAGDPEGRTGE